MSGSFSEFLSHRYCLGLLAVLLGINASAQDHRIVRTSFGLGGGLGRAILAPTPRIENLGTGVPTLAYAGKPLRGLRQRIDVVDEQGNLRKANMGEFNAELFGRLTLTSRNSNGWLLHAGYRFSRQSYAFDGVPYPFKNYTAGRFIGDLESHAFAFSVARFWWPYWFARLGGMYVTRYTVGGFNQPLDAFRYDYVENGTGYQVRLADRGHTNLALVPEFGVTSAQHPVELAFSLVVPLDRFAFRERYTYLQNGQVAGEALASHGTFAAAITLRLGLTLFSSQRYPRAPRNDRSVQPTAPGPKPTGQFTDRLESVRVGQALPLGSVQFALQTAELSGASQAELDELARWLESNPTVRIRLEGHTDVVGDVRENETLSLHRVEAVKKYLTRRGVRPDRIETVGYGSTRPLRTDCHPPLYCPENRRVEMVILSR
jgi:outer membrane protein OmpA-like peptidoglycan-associated protein